MATPKETVWELDPHTRAKHEILRRYLEAWFPILNKHNQRIVYIDGFSGPGRYKSGEPGSPLLALEVAASHRKALAGELVFWFIDEREDRVDHLRQELGAASVPAHFRIHVECGRFDEKLKLALDQLDAKGQVPAPTFAFVDPFGFSGIPFSLIERLLKHRRCEARITFMADSVNRWLEHPDQKILTHIVETFGTQDALKIAAEPNDRIGRLRALYQSQLQTVASFVRYFEMRDRQDRPQYYLFFASNHELGHLKIKEAMWGVDPDGTFRFSDATVPGQLVLFEADPATPLLRLLRGRFRGQGAVIGAVVRRFIENETPFLKKHMTAALRQAEGNEEVKVVPTKVDGKKRKAGTFPDEVRMTFVEPGKGDSG